MAKKTHKAKLKVFRTAAGFHDAYVAAPSQKAALEAWGTETNLFAAGAAEPVSDPALTKEPLARPGTVIRKLCGSEREHVAALGKAGAARAKTISSPRPSPAGRKGRKKPSRAALEKAEAALAAYAERQAKAVETLRRQEAAIAGRRRELERKGAAESGRLEDRVEEERARLEDAMILWEEPDR